MKTKLIILVMLIVCISCGTNSKPVSDAQKEKIKGEVKEVVNTITKGCEEANFDMAMQQWLDSPDFIYINNGMTFSYKEFVDMAKPVFSTLLNQKGTIVNEKYAVLDNSTVLYTNNSKWLMNFKDGHSILQDPWVMQIIFKKIGSQWRVINCVESGAEKNVASESSKGLNQAELLKKFVGNWEKPLGKDTSEIFVIKNILGGNGVSLYSKGLTKGKLLYEGIGTWGYDAKNNNIELSCILYGEIWHSIGEFTSTDKLQFIFPNNPNFSKVTYESISPNEIKETAFMNDKTETSTYKRIK